MRKRPKMGGLPQLIGVVSRLDGTMASYPGIMTFFGTLSFLCIVQITNGYHYVNENTQSQDCSDDMTEAPCVFARLDD